MSQRRRLLFAFVFTVVILGGGLPPLIWFYQKTGRLAVNYADVINLYMGWSTP